MEYYTAQDLINIPEYYIPKRRAGFALLNKTFLSSLHKCVIHELNARSAPRVPVGGRPRGAWVWSPLHHRTAVPRHSVRTLSCFIDITFLLEVLFTIQNLILLRCFRIMFQFSYSDKHHFDYICISITCACTL